MWMIRGDGDGGVLMVVIVEEHLLGDVMEPLQVTVMELHWNDGDDDDGDGGGGEERLVDRGPLLLPLLCLP